MSRQYPILVNLMKTVVNKSEIFLFQNNLNYAICIKKQWDACTVTYANEVDSVENDFQLINVDAGESRFVSSH